MNLATTQYTLSTKTFEVYVSGCREHPCKPDIFKKTYEEVAENKTQGRNQKWLH